jgi:hypothetical protein
MHEPWRRSSEQIIKLAAIPDPAIESIQGTKAKKKKTGAGQGPKIDWDGVAG